FRDAAYEGLSYKRRGALHAKVGEAYERLEQEGRGEFAELLSLHLFHAGDLEKTYRYSLLAGERAQAKYANVEAASFYRRALEVAPKLDEEPDGLAGVWESLGDVSELAGLYSDAAEAYSKARKLDNHPRLLLKEGIIRERFGRYPEALRWYTRGLNALDQLDAEEQREMRFELSLAYAGVRVRQGEFADGIEWCKKVIDEANQTSDLPALAHAYHLAHLGHISLRTLEPRARAGSRGPARRRWQAAARGARGLRGDPLQQPRDRGEDEARRAGGLLSQPERRAAPRRRDAGRDRGDRRRLRPARAGVPRARLRAHAAGRPRRGGRGAGAEPRRRPRSRRDLRVGAHPRGVRPPGRAPRGGRERPGQGVEGPAGPARRHFDPGSPAFARLDWDSPGT